MTFKNLAKKARNRVISAREIQEKTISRALSVQTSYYINANLSKAEDDPLYSKVKKMLEGNKDISSPIGKLIDHSIFDSLSDENKDRYLLDLSKRYNAMKKQYEKEISTNYSPV